MKQFFKRIATTLSRNPAWRGHIDIGESLYRDANDTTPAYSYAVKASFKITLRQVLAAGALVACLCLSKKAKHK